MPCSCVAADTPSADLKDPHALRPQHPTPSSPRHSGTRLRRRAGRSPCPDPRRCEGQLRRAATPRASGHQGHPGRPSQPRCKGLPGVPRRRTRTQRAPSPSGARRADRTHGQPAGPTLGRPGIGGAWGSPAGAIRGQAPCPPTPTRAQRTVRCHGAPATRSPRGTAPSPPGPRPRGARRCWRSPVQGDDRARPGLAPGSR